MDNDNTTSQQSTNIPSGFAMSTMDAFKRLRRLALISIWLSALSLLGWLSLLALIALEVVSRGEFA
jgi:hypothetical protein